MVGFIVRRLVAMLLVLVLVSFLTFTLFYKGATNPAAMLCEQRPPCTAEKLANWEARMGFDKGLVVNYGEFLKGLFVGRTIDQGEIFDCHAPCFGVSYKTGVQITDDFVDRYPATISLAFGAAILFLLLGVTIGILAAKYRGSAFDKFLVTASLVISSVPYYILALVSWIYLTQIYEVFPQSEYVSPFESPIKWASGLLLPWLVLALAFAPTYARYTRGQMVETIGEDYVRSAVAKGVAPRAVMFKHAFRATLVPIVTIFGLDLGALLAGTLFTEMIFGINGIGLWTIEALRGSIDFPVLTAATLLGSFLIVVSNFLVDLLYGFLDPRVRIA